jgi:hypothetical protein
MVGLLPETNARAEADDLVYAWDFKARPAPRDSTGRWGAAAMIQQGWLLACSIVSCIPPAAAGRCSMHRSRSLMIEAER